MPNNNFYKSTYSGEHIDAILGAVVNKQDKEEGKGLSTNDFTDAYKEKLEGLEGQMQSDWNQNDETQADYVKNRTHYEVPAVVLGERHMTSEETQEGLFDGICDVYFNFIPDTGKAYKYSINGDEGSFEFTEIPEVNGSTYLSIGNASGYMYRWTEAALSWQPTFAYGSTIDILLYESGEVKPLEDKYIPDTIARMADVEAMIGVVNDELESILNGGVD